MVDRQEDLIASAKALLPYLKTSSDPERALEQSNDPRFDPKLSRADWLRAEADLSEAEEAAIWRFRKVLEPFMDWAAIRL